MANEGQWGRERSSNWAQSRREGRTKPDSTKVTWDNREDLLQAWVRLSAGTFSSPGPSPALSAFGTRAINKALNTGKVLPQLMPSPRKPLREDKGGTPAPLKSELRTSGAGGRWGGDEEKSLGTQQSLAVLCSPRLGHGLARLPRYKWAQPTPPQKNNTSSGKRIQRLLVTGDNGKKTGFKARQTGLWMEGPLPLAVGSLSLLLWKSQTIPLFRGCEN